MTLETTKQCHEVISRWNVWLEAKPSEAQATVLSHLPKKKQLNSINHSFKVNLNVTKWKFDGFFQLVITLLLQKCKLLIKWQEIASKTLFRYYFAPNYSLLMLSILTFCQICLIDFFFFFFIKRLEHFFHIFLVSKDMPQNLILIVKSKIYVWKLNKFQLQKLQTVWMITAVVLRNFDIINKYDVMWPRHKVQSFSQKFQ